MVKTNTFDAGLERVDPVTHTARDASHFRRMVAARKAVEAADAELLTAVQEARADGDSWTTIAVALGVSRRAAQQRFGGKASSQAVELRPPERDAQEEGSRISGRVVQRICLDSAFSGLDNP